ncbi:GIY-YIG nuclease family protein [Lacinutrix mariniflava]|uniref:GIY-YIG nuclease family protein n=1 Tax=Lacinutrix mariniflava TaxID=342955 RepID=UPI0006E2EF84|nr:GIY-YIG nuclease family protein [Lacinutrix mariniflava]
MEHTVYILHSIKLDKFYTGETADFNIRIEFHKNAESRKFTAKANDWTLFLKFQCENKTIAKKIELHIKKMKSKVYIKNLKKYPEIISKLKEKYKS